MELKKAIFLFVFLRNTFYICTHDLHLKFQNMNLAPDSLSIKPVIHAIPSVTAEWDYKDFFGAIKVRWGIGRDHYMVVPGLYRIGNPDSQSDVFISANYKLSFDHLRKNLSQLDAWILVIDTKGINVWCAAGKGTFGTENIIRSIKAVNLDAVVLKKRIIIPQLGAPGVAAHVVREQTGFKVMFGPVRAKDIKAYLAAGYKANAAMRRVTFPFHERAKLIPVDFMYGKYKLLIALTVFMVLSGLDKQGILFGKIADTFQFPAISIMGSYVAGIVLTPLLLPYIPFRLFSVKGALIYAIVAVLLTYLFQPPVVEAIALGLTGIAIASFVAMNFTGSSTYTSLSGVKKEMKGSIPFQIAFALSGIILFIISKLN